MKNPTKKNLVIQTSLSYLGCHVPPVSLQPDGLDEVVEGDVDAGLGEEIFDDRRAAARHHVVDSSGLRRLPADDVRRQQSML